MLYRVMLWGGQVRTVCEEGPAFPHSPCLRDGLGTISEEWLACGNLGGLYPALVIRFTENKAKV